MTHRAQPRAAFTARGARPENRARSSPDPDTRPQRSDASPMLAATAWAGVGQHLADSVRKLKLRSGDKVARTEAWVDSSTGEIQTFTDDNVVSSIGASGLVYFKGGNGKCAWPSALARVTDA